MPMRRGARRAFTLVEAGVAAALLAGLLLTTLGFLHFGRRHGATSTMRSDFQRMGLLTVSHVMANLFGAREVLVPVSGQERACCFQGWDGRFHVYAFNRKRGVLSHRIVDVASARVGEEKVLATDVQTAHFALRDGAALLNMRIVFARKRPGSETVEVYPLETSLALRN